MVPGAEEVGDGGAGGQPAGKGHAELGPVQGGQARLQHVPSRVTASRILVPRKLIDINKVKKRLTR